MVFPVVIYGYESWTIKKAPMLGKTEGKRRKGRSSRGWDGQKASRTQWPESPPRSEMQLLPGKNG